MKKTFLFVVLAVLLVMSIGQSVWAFSDTKDDPNAAKIEALQKMGILAGEPTGHYNPKGTLTYAAGITLLVKAFDLNIDNIRFIKAPKASDYFPNLKDDAWYSAAFIIAAHNGLEIPKSVKADQVLTREQFAHHLFRSIARTGEYSFIEIFITINDEADINPAYMDSIQKLLISKIAELDKEKNFYPNNAITRGEAAGWLHGGIKFTKKYLPSPAPHPVPQSAPLYDVKIDVKAISDKVNEVTVSAQAPHPGYGIRVASIVFDGTNAIITAEAVHPDPDQMYPQVITEVKTVTYVGTEFKPVLSDNDSDSSNVSQPKQAAPAA